MNVSDQISHITNWISNYAKSNSNKTFELVVGVSGGIDSAVTSTLCAITGIRTHAVSMPIKQNPNQHDLSLIHINWLKKKYDNILTYIIDLDEVFKIFQKTMNEFDSELAFSNSRARLRMVTLYQIAQYYKGLVVGTGNKVEDFGIGFFTKYGDGGVDISPIGDLMKSEVYDLAHKLKINKEIIHAIPTDGLWEDERTDVDQLGVSYNDLEWAMMYQKGILDNNKSNILKVYKKHRKMNLHKMKNIPVFKK